MFAKKRRFPFEKRVLITGAGSGFGRALALEFAKDGWRIAAADINHPRAVETIGLVGNAGGSGIAVQCDVTKIEDLEKTAALVEEQWGGIDIVVNNAGVAAAGYIEKIPQDQWDWILDLNLKSVILGARAFVPLLEKQGGGHIVNMASAAGFACLPEMSCYNVTKAAVISLSETMRVELSKKNIGVTVVAPTFFKTNLMDQFRSTDDRQRKMAELFFKGSLVSAEYVARSAYKAIRKNRLYAVPQIDAKLIWFLRRWFPNLYFGTMGFFYKRDFFLKESAGH